MYEYPKEQDITPNQKAFLSDYFAEFERALAKDDFGTEVRTYTQYIVVQSFVDYFLINELCRNVDAYRLSTYLQKDRDGKLAMGPVWDFNIGFDEGERIPSTDWVVNYNDYVKNDPWMVPFWWDRLLADPQFKKAVKDRWNFLRKGELSLSTLNSVVDEMVTFLQKNEAVQRNYSKWDQGIGVNYDQSVQNMKVFLAKRANWMDGQISGW